MARVTTLMKYYGEAPVPETWTTPHGPFRVRVQTVQVIRQEWEGKEKRRPYFLCRVRVLNSVYEIK